MTDLLFELLIEALAKADNFEKRFDEKKHTNLNILKKFVFEKCKYNLIQAKMELAPLKSMFKSLMGPRRRRIFENITTDDTNIFTLFGQGNLPNAKGVSKLWTDYWQLDQFLRSDHTENKGEVIRGMTRAFLDDFVEVYDKKNITPYLHALVHHLPEMYEKHGDLNFFTTQGEFIYKHVLNYAPIPPPY